MTYRAEERVTVPYYRLVLEPAQRVHFTVIHDHDYGVTRRKAFVR